MSDSRSNSNKSSQPTPQQPTPDISDGVTLEDAVLRFTSNPPPKKIQPPPTQGNLSLTLEEIRHLNPDELPNLDKLPIPAKPRPYLNGRPAVKIGGPQFNLEHFGVESPTIYKSVKREKGIAYFRPMTLEDIRNTKGFSTYLYVITPDAKLVIAPRTTVWYHDLDGSLVGRKLCHTDLLGGYLGLGGGEVTIENYKIVVKPSQPATGINNQTGHLLVVPSEQQKIIVETAFIKNGYTEAKGKYVPSVFGIREEAPTIFRVPKVSPSALPEMDLSLGKEGFWKNRTLILLNDGVTQVGASDKVKLVSEIRGFVGKKLNAPNARPPFKLNAKMPCNPVGPASNFVLGPGIAIAIEWWQNPEGRYLCNGMINYVVGLAVFGPLVPISLPHMISSEYAESQRDEASGEYWEHLNNRENWTFNDYQFNTLLKQNAKGWTWVCTSQDMTRWAYEPLRDIAHVISSGIKEWIHTGQPPDGVKKCLNDICSFVADPFNPMAPLAFLAYGPAQKYGTQNEVKMLLQQTSHYPADAVPSHEINNTTHSSGNNKTENVDNAHSFVNQGKEQVPDITSTPSTSSLPSWTCEKKDGYTLWSGTFVPPLPPSNHSKEDVLYSPEMDEHFFNYMYDFINQPQLIPEENAKPEPTISHAPKNPFYVDSNEANNKKPPRSVFETILDGAEIERFEIGPVGEGHASGCIGINIHTKSKAEIGIGAKIQEGGFVCCMTIKLLSWGEAPGAAGAAAGTGVEIVELLGQFGSAVWAAAPYMAAFTIAVMTASFFYQKHLQEKADRIERHLTRHVDLTETDLKKLNKNIREWLPRLLELQGKEPSKFKNEYAKMRASFFKINNALTRRMNYAYDHDAFDNAFYFEQDKQHLWRQENAIERNLKDQDLLDRMENRVREQYKGQSIEDAQAAKLARFNELGLKLHPNKEEYMEREALRCSILTDIDLNTLNQNPNLLQQRLGTYFDLPDFYQPSLLRPRELNKKKGSRRHTAIKFDNMLKKLKRKYYHYKKLADAGVNSQAEFEALMQAKKEYKNYSEKFKKDLNLVNLKKNKTFKTAFEYYMSSINYADHSVSSSFEDIDNALKAHQNKTTPFYNPEHLPENYPALRCNLNAASEFKRLGNITEAFRTKHKDLTTPELIELARLLTAGKLRFSLEEIAEIRGLEHLFLFSAYQLANKGERVEAEQLEQVARDCKYVVPAQINHLNLGSIIEGATEGDKKSVLDDMTRINIRLDAILTSDGDRTAAMNMLAQEVANIIKKWEDRKTEIKKAKAVYNSKIIYIPPEIKQKATSNLSEEDWNNIIADLSHYSDYLIEQNPNDQPANFQQSSQADWNNITHFWQQTDIREKFITENAGKSARGLIDLAHHLTSKVEYTENDETEIEAYLDIITWKVERLAVLGKIDEAIELIEKIENCNYFISEDKKEVIFGQVIDSAEIKKALVHIKEHKDEKTNYWITQIKESPDVADDHPDKQKNKFIKDYANAKVKSDIFSQVLEEKFAEAKDNITQYKAAASPEMAAQIDLDKIDEMFTRFQENKKSGMRTGIWITELEAFLAQENKESYHYPLGLALIRQTISKNILGYILSADFIMARVLIGDFINKDPQQKEWGEKIIVHMEQVSLSEHEGPEFWLGKMDEINVQMTLIKAKRAESNEDDTPVLDAEEQDLIDKKMVQVGGAQLWIQGRCELGYYGHAAEFLDELQKKVPEINFTEQLDTCRFIYRGQRTDAVLGLILQHLFPSWVEGLDPSDKYALKAFLEAYHTAQIFVPNIGSLLVQGFNEKYLLCSDMKVFNKSISDIKKQLNKDLFTDPYNSNCALIGSQLFLKLIQILPLPANWETGRYWTLRIGNTGLRATYAIKAIQQLNELGLGAVYAPYHLSTLAHVAFDLSMAGYHHWRASGGEASENRELYMAEKTTSTALQTFSIPVYLSLITPGGLGGWAYLIWIAVAGITAYVGCKHSSRQEAANKVLEAAMGNISSPLKNIASHSKTKALYRYIHNSDYILHLGKPSKERLKLAMEKNEIVIAYKNDNYFIYYPGDKKETPTRLQVTAPSILRQLNWPLDAQAGTEIILKHKQEAPDLKKVIKVAETHMLTDYADYIHKQCDYLVKHKAPSVSELDKVKKNRLILFTREGKHYYFYFKSKSDKPYEKYEIPPMPSLFNQQGIILLTDIERYEMATSFATAYIVEIWIRTSQNNIDKQLHQMFGGLRYTDNQFSANNARILLWVSRIQDCYEREKYPEVMWLTRKHQKGNQPVTINEDYRFPPYIVWQMIVYYRLRHYICSPELLLKFIEKYQKYSLYIGEAPEAWRTANDHIVHKAFRELVKSYLETVANTALLKAKTQEERMAFLFAIIQEYNYCGYGLAVLTLAQGEFSKKWGLILSLLFKMTDNFPGKQYALAFLVYHSSNKTNLLESLKYLLLESNKDKKYWQLLHSILLQCLRSAQYKGNPHHIAWLSALITISGETLSTFSLSAQERDETYKSIKKAKDYLKGQVATNTSHTLFAQPTASQTAYKLNDLIKDAKHSLLDTEKPFFSVIEKWLVEMSYLGEHDEKYLPLEMQADADDGDSIFYVLGTTRQDALSLLKAEVEKQRKEIIELLLNYLETKNKTQHSRDPEAIAANIELILANLDQMAETNGRISCKGGKMAFLDALSLALNMNIRVYVSTKENELKRVHEITHDEDFDSIAILHSPKDDTHSKSRLCDYTKLVYLPTAVEGLTAEAHANIEIKLPTQAMDKPPKIDPEQFFLKERKRPTLFQPPLSVNQRTWQTVAQGTPLPRVN